MASLTCQILALLLILFFTSPSSVSCFQIQVNLSNNFSKDNLNSSCHSVSGRDLGKRTMSPGTSFTWAASELWCCSLNTDFYSERYGIFPMFNPKTDTTRCGEECRWSVRDDGIYLYIADAYAYEFQYKWGIFYCI